MATWYVRTSGSDSNAGTSAGAAFLTIGKAMTQASLAAGDTIYVGAGTYRVSSTIAPTSMASMTYLYGDTDGSKTGDAGEVIVTNFATSDSAASTAIGSVFLFSSANYWTIGNLSIISGGWGTTDSVNPIGITGTSSNLTFQDLAIWSGYYGILSYATTFGVQQSFTVQRCRIWARNAIQLDSPRSASGADTDCKVAIRNSVLSATGFGIVVLPSGGTATYKTGGVTVRNCISLGNSGSILVNNGASTTYPLVATNNLLICPANVVINSSTVSGQVVEDYNVIEGSTPRTNVTAGANSTTNARNWRFSIGHEASFGAVTRPFGEFPANSPLLTWGGTAVPTDDINGVTRPASGASQGTAQQALGPFERSNSATRETTTTRTGGTALKIAGPGYQDFELAVAPVSTTVSVYGYKDATYGTAATAPQMIVTNGGEAGVANATATMTAGTATWGAMSLTFTPASAGIVTVRLQSNATVGSASAYFDDFSVA